MTKILVLDNYDSFVYTLNGYLRQLGAETSVVRNDVVSEAEISQLLKGFDAVLLSPGPGTPAEAGLSIPMVKYAIEHRVPVFGVCLGHQAIAEAMGATVRQADELMHGKTSLVDHDDSLIFTNLNHPFTATRYHSLAIVRETLPDDLLVTAETIKSDTSAGGVIMGVRHASLPIYGVQFHPESVLTEGGYQMLGNWLESIGLAGAAQRAKSLSPLITK
jgi:para-aminobenzoate synthetase component 2